MKKIICLLVAFLIFLPKLGNADKIGFPLYDPNLVIRGYVAGIKSNAGTFSEPFWTPALYYAGVIIPLSDGGTGSNLSAPSSDKILFYDYSDSNSTWLSIGDNLEITNTTLAIDSNSNMKYSLEASDGDPNNVVYVDAAGNVGVGDVTPSYKLDVNGTGRFMDNITLGAKYLSYDGTDTGFQNNAAGTGKFKGAGGSYSMFTIQSTAGPDVYLVLDAYNPGYYSYWYVRHESYSKDLMFIYNNYVGTPTFTLYLSLIHI